jgi:formylglycine-generating enzyme
MFTMKVVRCFCFLFLVVGNLTSFAQKFPEMIRVDGGTFTMGNEEVAEPEDSVALPLHQVTLKTFRMAKTETTVAQWRAFCNATGRQMPNAPNWGWIDNHPVVNISWDDAISYCKWLSDTTGKTYRLPTEAEWEYAARGGKKSKGFIYAGGQSMYSTGWYEENSNAGTQPVAQKRPNELGLFDMSGNVWEWCQDWFGAYTAEAQTNPQGSNENQYFKILRGGSWNYVMAGCRVAHRNYFSPESRLNDYGFRVVMEDDGKSAATTETKPTETPKEPSKPKKSSKKN